MPAVVGIDLAAGRGVTAVATLMVEDGSRRPVFYVERHQLVTTDEAITSVVASMAPAVVAIDAPLTLPRAVMQGLAIPRGFHGPAYRQKDSLHTARLDGESPYTRAAERDPIWSALGIRPLPVSFLGGLTFHAISLLPRLRVSAPGAAIIEVFPTATFQRLGITRPMQGAQRRRAAKTTEWSRRSIQLGLQKHIAGVPSPNDQLYDTDTLDALAAALTGVAYLTGMYEIAGDEAEGAIILPL